MQTPDQQPDNRNQAEQLHYYCGTLAGAIIKLELLGLNEQLTPEGSAELAAIVQALRQTCTGLRVNQQPNACALPSSEQAV